MSESIINILTMSFNKTCDQQMYKDMSDQATCRALYVLAAINLFVILQGVYTVRLRLQYDTQ